MMSGEKIRVPYAFPEAVFITPEMAHEWLKTNRNFRPLNRRRVQSLVRVILEGKWKLDGATIVFDEEENLADGQHRLAACVAANIGITSFVIRNVPGKCPDRDTGKPRRLADYLTASGARNEREAARLATALRLVWLAEQAGTQALCWSGGGDVYRAAPSELMDTLAAHPLLRHSINFAKQAEPLIPRAQLGALRYLFATLGGNPMAADDFVLVLADKKAVPCPEQDAVVHLRRQLTQVRALASGRRPSAGIIRALAIKAWNYWARNEPCNQLKLRLTGVSAEPWPEINPWGGQDAEGTMIGEPV